MSIAVARNNRGDDGCDGQSPHQRSIAFGWPLAEGSPSHRAKEPEILAVDEKNKGFSMLVSQLDRCGAHKLNCAVQLTNDGLRSVVDGGELRCGTGEYQMIKSGAKRLR